MQTMSYSETSGFWDFMEPCSGNVLQTSSFQKALDAFAAALGCADSSQVHRQTATGGSSPPQSQSCASAPDALPALPYISNSMVAELRRINRSEALHNRQPAALTRASRPRELSAPPSLPCLSGLSSDSALASILPNLAATQTALGVQRVQTTPSKPEEVALTFDDVLAGYEPELDLLLSVPARTTPMFHLSDNNTASRDVTPPLFTPTMSGPSLLLPSAQTMWQPLTPCESSAAASPFTGRKRSYSATTEEYLPNCHSGFDPLERLVSSEWTTSTSQDTHPGQSLTADSLYRTHAVKRRRLPALDAQTQRQVARQTVSESLLTSMSQDASGHSALSSLTEEVTRDWEARCDALYDATPTPSDSSAMLPLRGDLGREETKQLPHAGSSNSDMARSRGSLVGSGFNVLAGRGAAGRALQSTVSFSTLLDGFGSDLQWF